MVVRDEERFLDANLRAQAALGVSEVYIYLDRCCDRTAEIAERHPITTPVVRDRRADQRHMSTYQCACLADALVSARAAGHRWLMHVDADEFARGTLDFGGRLPETLDTLPPSVEQAVLKPVDSLPTLPGPQTLGDGFLNLTWFQTGVLRRRVLNPGTRRVERLRKRLGHTRGKPILRLDTDAMPHSAHTWRRTGGGRLSLQHIGRLYHYVAVDAALWHAKHAKFSEYPATWSKGAAVSFPKQAWKEAAPGMSPAEARHYFERWLRVGARELAWARFTGRAVHDTFVRDLLRAT